MTEFCQLTKVVMADSNKMEIVNTKKLMIMIRVSVSAHAFECSNRSQKNASSHSLHAINQNWLKIFLDFLYFFSLKYSIITQIRWFGDFVKH